MIRLLLAISFLSTCFDAISQVGSIKGYVHDITVDDAFMFVEVSLEGDHYKTYADLNGNFTLDSIPTGTYNLKVYQPGYNEMILSSIRVKEDEITELKIEYPAPCNFSEKKSACPICKKRNKVVPIVYGLPSGELLEEAEKGEFYLGGCVVTFCDPQWYCNRDKKAF